MPVQFGRYFVIRSHLNNFVLEVEAGCRDVEAPIRTWPQSDDAADMDHQLWFSHTISGTIRNKATGFCIDMKDDNKMVVSPYKKFRRQQNWYIKGKNIVSKYDTNLVLDIPWSNFLPGVCIEAYAYMGLPNQMWEFTYLPARYFALKNKANGKILDVKKGSPNPRTKVITWHDKGDKANNQLWYEDQNGVIRSKLNDYAFDSTDSVIRLMPYKPQNKTQQWFFVDGFIRNLHNLDEALEVKRTDPLDGSNIIVSEFTNTKNSQKWSIVYNV